MNLQYLLFPLLDPALLELPQLPDQTNFWLQSIVFQKITNDLNWITHLITLGSLQTLTPTDSFYTLREESFKAVRLQLHPGLLLAEYMTKSKWCRDDQIETAYRGSRWAGRSRDSIKTRLTLRAKRNCLNLLMLFYKYSYKCLSHSVSLFSWGSRESNRSSLPLK